MKKKTIEKIPFLKLPRTVRRKTAVYAAVAAVKEIGTEPHLFVEVYRNQKECRQVPAARIVVTENDFGTYFPENGTWTRGKITGNSWNCRNLIWTKPGDRTAGTGKTKEERNILYSRKDLEVIKNFLKDVEASDVWWKYIEQKQDEITCDEENRKKRRKQEKREQALEERKRNTAQLPEERIGEYAERVFFHDMHYIYYKKHKNRADTACSVCGGTACTRWRPGTTYESSIEKMIEEPREGRYGTCPLCGARGRYIPQGRAKKAECRRKYIFLGEKYKENGFVIRYIKAKKECRLELMCGESGAEMHSAYEKLDIMEVSRIYFEPGEKVQKDCNRYSYYTKEEKWDDRLNIRVCDGHVMPETYVNIKGTFLQYSALEEYGKRKTSFNPADYLERYVNTPQIEMLEKMGLDKVVDELISYHYGIVRDETARRPDTFLGIRKERVKQLIRNRGDISILRTMQAEKSLGQNWTDEQIEKISELGGGYAVSRALEYMGIQRFLNRVSAYAGCGYGTMCGRALDRLKSTANTYIDYLDMRKALGYDMHNTVYLFPRDLRAAHDRMVMEKNKEEADKRIREANEKYPLIKKHYRRLRKEFYHEDEEFFIRPARSAGEIVEEGRILHHCVGGHRYLDKHNRDVSTILFLRTKKEPEMPFITVEIETDTLKIQQWYGMHDRKPDEKKMQEWLNAYVERLQAGKTGADEAAGEERMTLMAAV